MPANYAHYRFGKQALPGFPAEARQCVQRFRRMFDMGLHGPDIFFFYNPLAKTSVGSLNGRYHALSGRELFSQAALRADSEAARAYLYGLLGHYCLDGACHPFVQKMAESGAADHVKLEAEFDRYLMALDKIPAPHTFDQSKRYHLTRGECMTVAQFYPPATGANISACVHHMAWMTRIAAGKHRGKAEKMADKLKMKFSDGLIPEEPVKAYARMDSELLSRYNRALKQYPVMLEALIRHMQTGEALGADFESDFG